MNGRAATGLIVGRFDPPHLGHSYLIDAGRVARCERLAVFVNSGPRDAVPGAAGPDGWPSCTPTSR